MGDLGPLILLCRLENGEELFLVPAANAVIKCSKLNQVVVFDGFDVDVGIMCKVSVFWISDIFQHKDRAPRSKVLSSAPYATASADLAGAYLCPGLLRSPEFEDYRGPTGIGEVLGTWAHNANVREGRS